MRFRVFLSVLPACLVCLLVLGVGSASAAFPGLNGRISGTHLSKDANDDDVFGLVWFGLDGGGFERPVFGANAFGGVWSPDGTKLLYARVDNSTTSQKASNLFVFSELTGQVEPVVTDHPNQSGFGVWSPDGQKIAYAHPSSTMVGKFDLSIRDLNTGREYLAAVNVETPFIPSWSVRGQIAFVRKVGRDKVVVVLTLPTDLAQPGVEKVIDPVDVGGAQADDLESPDFSPSGDRLVVTLDEGNHHSSLVFVDPDGSNPAAVTRSTSADANGVWSPDGKKLVFISARGGSGPQVYTRNAVTLAQVASGASADEVPLPNTEDIGLLSWQPVHIKPGSPVRVIDPVSHRPTTHPRRDRDTNAPIILAAKITKPVLSRKTARGNISLRLSEDAKVQIIIRRKGKGSKPVIQIVRNARAGLNKITFPTRQTTKRGKQKRRTALKPGQYQIVITAKDKRGNTSKPQTLTLTVKKR